MSPEKKLPAALSGNLQRQARTLALILGGAFDAHVRAYNASRRLSRLLIQGGPVQAQRMLEAEAAEEAQRSTRYTSEATA